MPAINVTLKDGASPEELQKAKNSVVEQGGKVTDEYKLIKGFRAEFPDDKVHSLKTNEHMDVEADGEVRTQ